MTVEIEGHEEAPPCNSHLCTINDFRFGKVLEPRAMKPPPDNNFVEFVRLMGEFNHLNGTKRWINKHI